MDSLLKFTVNPHWLICAAWLRFLAEAALAQEQRKRGGEKTEGVLRLAAGACFLFLMVFILIYAGERPGDREGDQAYLEQHQEVTRGTRCLAGRRRCAQPTFRAQLLLPPRLPEPVGEAEGEGETAPSGKGETAAAAIAEGETDGKSWPTAWEEPTAEELAEDIAAQLEAEQLALDDTACTADHDPGGMSKSSVRPAAFI